ncbi:ABC transporter ATP-binding protein [Saccharothrix xinjiangensis]|uniref:ABC transporter ATP-binding protein n=1 Tax=Saccharothrix xinjiangensis TaxID=204798 RepID=A0ABV9Y2M3_9PSEU
MSGEVEAEPSGGAPPPGPEPAAPGGLKELIAPVKSSLVLAAVLAAVGAIASLAPFVAIYELALELLSPDPDEGRVWTVVAIAVLGLVLRFLCEGTAFAVSHRADNRLQAHLRRRVVAHLGRLPLGWFTEKNAGTVKTAVQDDVLAMHHLVGHSVVEFVSSATAPVAALLYLLFVDWRLMLVTIVTLPIYAAFYVIATRKSGENVAQYGAALGRINAAVIEFVQGIAVVKAFGQTRRAHERFTTASDDYVAFMEKWISPVLKPQSVTSACVSPPVILLAVLTGGAIFVGQGWVRAVDLLPFALLGVGLTAPLVALGYTGNDIRSAGAAAARIGVLLATPTMTDPAEPRVPAGNLVEFDHVDFGYGPEKQVLHDVSAVLRPGTVTALVGPSGAGKSTLASLLPRFFDVDRGSIRIGGVDLRDVATAELYRHVGFVFQDVRLLRMSVRDNIRLARPDADDAAVESAARSAQVHDVVQALPRGYDSVVGEDAKFSGGEAQRVSIARALLADTPVLVLDEATAFADAQSEAAIQDALSELAAGRTLLVIAHRLHTVADADQILVLDEGRVVERGRHADLLRANGLYARLWAAGEHDVVEVGA